MFRAVASVLAVVTVSLFATWSGYSGAQENQPDYRNPNLPVEQRVADLLGRMTVEEKVAQLQNRWDDEGMTPAGVGGITLVPARGEGTPLERCVRTVNAIQKRIIENSRLGIPAIFHDETLHGFAKAGATSFPHSIALAATWDVDLMDRVAEAIAREARAAGCRQALSPVINIANDPRWGRTQETYGEDPYLTSRMAVAYCKAFTREGIVTTPKHFVANFGDGGRDSNPVHFSERLLREVYFPPFEACIKEAGSLSLMPAFNSLDGRPCNANRWLLTDVLRNEWGFRGFTVCDYDALHEIQIYHHTAETLEDAAVQALTAGLDVEVPGIRVYGQPLLDAVKSGRIPMTVLDEAVSRRLEVKFRIGLFEDPYPPDLEAGEKVYNSPEHHELALQAARESIVLLKNAGNALPFRKDLKSIAVIGARADSALLGNYSRPGGGRVSILEGIRNAVSPATKVVFERGTEQVEYRLPLVPAEYLSHVENGRKIPGLKAEFFSNMELRGEPAVVRTDSQINLDAGGSPAPGIGGDFVSYRYTGRLRAPLTGKLTLSITSGDGVRFFFGGEKILESWTDRYSTTDYRTVTVVKGREYDIVMEVQENKWETKAFLGWDYRLETAENSRIARAASAAKKAGAAVVVATIVEGEFIDRADLNLPGYQEKLIRAVAATGVPTAVVLVGGGAVTMSGWLDDVPAVLSAWYGGDEGGTAVAEALFGDFSPSGRLPVSFPREASQLPMPYYFKPSGRGYDYGFMSARPLFPFGHGLSYTKFEYSPLRFDRTVIRPDGSVTVSVDIRNTGKVRGDEVAQLYVRDLVGSVTRPLKELKGFRRVSLDPGESKTVAFTLSPEELKMLDEGMRWVVEPGEFRVMVGASSEDIRAEGTFRVR